MQDSYSYQTQKGVPGGLADITTYSIDSRLNGEDAAGKLKFGMGAVQGDNPGKDVKVPDSTATSSKFEGVVLTSFTQQQTLEGGVAINPKQTVGILRYGKSWVRVEPDITINYGDKLYLIINGDNAGLFTNEDTDNIAVNGRFDSDVDGGTIAMVEIFNSAAV